MIPTAIFLAINKENLACNTAGSLSGDLGFNNPMAYSRDLFAVSKYEFI